MTAAVELRGVTKLFRRPGGGDDAPIAALRELDLEVASGEALGVVGANGAGKSTLLRVVASLLLPDAGVVRVAGADTTHDGARARAAVGLASAHERGFYGRLTLRQNLRFFGRLRGLDERTIVARGEELARRLQVEPLLDARVQSLSAGNLQRASLVRALLAAPKVLLLDEPTRSLDESSATLVRELVRDELVRARGTTVLVATHAARDLGAMCDRVLELDHGRALAPPAPVADHAAQRTVESLRVVARDPRARPWPRPLPADLADTRCDVLPSGDLALRFDRAPLDGRLDAVLRALASDGLEVLSVVASARLLDSRDVASDRAEHRA
jgi:ABC-2 type transport system ATP-binding protein